MVTAQLAEWLQIMIAFYLSACFKIMLKL